MATIIKIKRSAGTTTPNELGNGELAYTYGSGSQGNFGDRLFVGTGTETNGVAANIEIVGGKYFTEMLDHVPGVLTASSGIVTDSNNKIDQIKVDNLQLNGNTLSSTSGDIVISPTGAGKTVVDNLYTDSSTTLQEYIEDISGGSITDGTGISITYNDSAGTTTVATSAIPNSSLTNSDISITDGTTSSSIPLGGSFTVSPIANETTVTQSGGTFTLGLSPTVSGLTSLSATDLTGTLQTNAQPNITSLGTLDGLAISSSQTVSMGSNRITNVTDPTGDQDAATKAYVDATINGLDVKESVRVATTTNLGTTYSSNVLTASANGVLSVDGITSWTVGDRILVKDQVSPNEEHNGIYTVTNAGSVSAAYILSRATDANTGAKLTGGAFFFVEEGSNNSDNGYVTTHNGTPTLGTSDITFAQFSGAGQISAGAGLTKVGNQIDVSVDDSSIEITTDALNVKSLGITNAMISNASIDLTAKVTGILPVLNGGTGVSSLTSYRLLMASGTGELTVLGAGTSGQVMMSNGAAAPAFADVDGGTF
ncbi:MAG: hypothetical protein HOC66_05865 [Flavobacteriales bacterium]|jgi:hypothetical protein|nr:hypothetical protein [Flavobacteriales bacterium]